MCVVWACVWAYVCSVGVCVRAWACVSGGVCSGVPRNFVGGGSINSVEDREKGDLGAVAP